MSQTEHTSYRGLPALAGICSMAEAQRPGLSIEECVRRHKRYHYAFKRLYEIFNAHITAEPIYELKTGFSYHSYLCAELVTALRERVAEMREPPLGMDAVPDANLEMLFDEIIAAPTTEERLVGIYEKVIPALKAGLEHHVHDTNPLADHPSVRLCRMALIDVMQMEEFGAAAIASLVSAEHRHEMVPWLTLLDDCLAAAGGLDGTAKPVTKTLGRMHSASPYVYDREPKRDERFPDPYNMGVNAESFLYDPKYPPLAKTLMLYYKRLREIDVPEMMASIIHETRDKPWGYYRAMTRQLWDEARHAMMGEVGFARLGIDWGHLVMINSTWSRGLNTQLTPIERHAVLYFIEQGLMPKTGKRFEWEVGVASSDPLAATFQDYDWADEVLHSRIGRDWYIPQIGNAREAIAYGDRCWSKVLLDWGDFRRKGLTQHRNWWPDVYAEACKRWGIELDDEVLKFSDTYENKRADLKEISASG